MDELKRTPNTTITAERKQNLQYIKEYILSLLKKKKKVSDGLPDTIKELEKTFTEDTPKEAEKQLEEKKSFRDKLKEKLSGDGESGNEDGGESEKQEHNKKQKEEKEQESYMELAPEDEDEYMPHDSEFGEALGESPRFAEIDPPYLGYYNTGKKSYFNPKTNLRSKKKQLRMLEHSIEGNGQKYTYAGFVKPGITAIPLPDKALPDTNSLRCNGTQTPIFQIDQNNCVYIISKVKQAISFQFALNQSVKVSSPVSEDTQRIVFSELTAETQKVLTGIVGKNALDKARVLSYYIKNTKKYNTNRQGTLRNKSNEKNYMVNLDKSEVLECFSANSLLVALCREMGVPARLVVGHALNSVQKDGKGYITRNNGHARTEIRDGEKRQRLDATPTKKEDGEDSNQNMDEQQGNNSSADGNMDENADRDDNSSDVENGGESGQEGEGTSKEDGEKGNESKDEQGGEGGDQDGDHEQSSDSSPSNSSESKQKGSASGPREQKLQEAKTPTQMLDEFLKKAKEDNLTAQGEQLTQALEKLEDAGSKEDIRKILDEAGLSDFAKEELDKIGNQGILEEEKNNIKNLDDEKKLEEALDNSLLDPEYKKKLQEYADTIKQKIQEEKRRARAEMERFGFKETELELYKHYKEIEKSVMPEVRRQIEELQRILPPNYITSRDEENYYRSGSRLDRRKLVDRKVTGNTKIFQRSRVNQETQEINMFETIIIDRSGSMGSRKDENSPLSQSVKAAVIRAKVLEHFKADMSIVIFSDSLEEVMSFGETFSDRKTHIPSKLMRAYRGRAGGNSQEPITHVYTTMKERMRQLGGKSFGNISFIGDGDLYNFQQVPQLKAMIDDLKKEGMGVTAYYINNNERKMPLIEYYFGNVQDGNAVYAKDTKDLSAKIIGNHKTRLNLLIKKYLH